METTNNTEAATTGNETQPEYLVKVAEFDLKWAASHLDLFMSQEDIQSAIRAIRADERAKVEAENNAVKLELLAVFSSVICTPERGYTAESAMMGSDARKICAELKAAREVLATLNAGAKGDEAT